jgi:alkaline phosphatase D
MKVVFLLLNLFVTLSAFAQHQFNKQIDTFLDNSLRPFYFGVASGDPQQNSVVIWTKILPYNFEKASVKWQVATDTFMQNIVATGALDTDSSSAYTVKLLAKGLLPNTFYFYRFSWNGFYSPIGRTKTAPLNKVSDLKFGVVSCSNYQSGYFNAYRLLANRNDLNAIIHLGDYIYEGGISYNKKKPQIRNHIPGYEILNLEDYRSRYAQYRLDKDLMEAHRLHPFITIWDDHEFANNAYKEGAGNHQAKEGDWEVRKAIAKKVYFEWLPIADNSEESIVRKLNYGGLADIFMLDGRTEGRSKQLESPADSNLYNSNRTMLGKTQVEWLIQGIENSNAKWRLIGNQVIFSELDAHKLSKKHARLMDSWDGYPFERKEIMDSFYSHQLKNIIIVTGDIHTSWAFDLVQNPNDKNCYNAKTGKGVIGAEFVTPSVSSANLDERVPRGIAKFAGELIKDKSMNPHLRFNDMINHGYLLIDLNETRAKATWFYAATVKEKTQKFSSKNSWETNYNQNKLVKSK